MLHRNTILVACAVVCCFLATIRAAEEDAAPIPLIMARCRALLLHGTGPDAEAIRRYQSALDRQISRRGALRSDFRTMLKQWIPVDAEHAPASVSWQGNRRTIELPPGGNALRR